MKKLLGIVVVVFSIFSASSGYSQSISNDDPDAHFYGQANQACPHQNGSNQTRIDEPHLERVNNSQPSEDCCWHLCSRYEPCYYTTMRCIEVEVPHVLKCSRPEKRYYEVWCYKLAPMHYNETMCCQDEFGQPYDYEVQRCTIAPMYCKETICRIEPVYYHICRTSICKRWVPEHHCQYSLKYYWVPDTVEYECCQSSNTCK